MASPFYDSDREATPPGEIHLSVGRRGQEDLVDVYLLAARCWAIELQNEVLTLIYGSDEEDSTGVRSNMPGRG